MRSSRRSRRAAPSFAVGLAFLLCGLPATLHAHEFEVPVSVMAQEDGTFSYDAVFTAGPGGASLISALVEGLENIGSPDLIFDWFCLEHFDEGEQVVIPVTGSLADITQPGLMSITLDVCDGARLYRETEIHPFAPTSTSRVTWGTVKARF